MNPPRVASLGVHIVDILARPVATPPMAGGRHEVDEVRITAEPAFRGSLFDEGSSQRIVRSIQCMGNGLLPLFLSLMPASCSQV